MARLQSEVDSPRVATLRLQRVEILLGNMSFAQFGGDLAHLGTYVLESNCIQTAPEQDLLFFWDISVLDYAFLSMNLFIFGLTMS
jgi:hypothetical protein